MKNIILFSCLLLTTSLAFANKFSSIDLAQSITTHLSANVALNKPDVIIYGGKDISRKILTAQSKRSHYLLG